MCVHVAHGGDEHVHYVSGIGFVEVLAGKYTVKEFATSHKFHDNIHFPFLFVNCFQLDDVGMIINLKKARQRLSAKKGEDGSRTRARISISFRMSVVVSLVNVITLIATFSPVSRLTPNLTSA